MADHPLLGLDCDGIILDSNDMKSAAFADVLRPYGDEPVATFIAFQRAHFGMSRYRLIDRFFTDHLGREAEAGEADAVLARFGELCSARYLDQPLTEGAREALEAFSRAGLKPFVASGSDEVELREVMRRRGLAAYFSVIYGSPTPKPTNLLKACETCAPGVFVGDAAADFEAARHAGYRFVLMARYSADPDGVEALRAEHGFHAVHSLVEVADMVLGGRA